MKIEGNLESCYPHHPWNFFQLPQYISTPLVHGTAYEGATEAALAGTAVCMIKENMAMRQV
jgi:hypothetical protein